MDDDFNTAGALSAIHDLVREANKTIERAQAGQTGALDTLAQLTKTFWEMTTVLGFRFESPAAGSELAADLIEYLVELRERARSDRAFDRADEIRARLAHLGVSVEDTPSGPRWRLTGQRR
jgi:cysteinyl-tRNA synthetase